MSKETSKALNASIGQNIKAARNAIGLTQQQLAEKVGLSRPQIANIEGGKIGMYVNTVYDICIALMVPPSKILPNFTNL